MFCEDASEDDLDSMLEHAAHGVLCWRDAAMRAGIRESDALQMFHDAVQHEQELWAGAEVYDLEKLFSR